MTCGWFISKIRQCFVIAFIALEKKWQIFLMNE